MERMKSAMERASRSIAAFRKMYINDAVMIASKIIKIKFGNSMPNFVIPIPNVFFVNFLMLLVVEPKEKEIKAK